MASASTNGFSHRSLGLVCNPYHRGGITRWMVELASEWQRQGGQCWFMVPRPRKPFVSAGGRPTILELIEREPTELRPVVIAPEVGAKFEFGTEPSRAQVYSEAITSAVPAGVPLIVSDDSAAWMAAACVAHRNPFVGVAHSDEAHYYDLVLRYRRSLAAVVGVSHRVRERAVQRAEGTVPAATIPCGTNLTAAVRRPRPADSPLRLVWVGRLEERQKRVSDLPRLGVALRARGLPYEMEIVGDGDAANDVRAAVRAAGLTETIRMTGWLTAEDVRNKLAWADVLVLPSNFEGMPVAMMEALAAGCAVVASRVSGVEDYDGHPLARGCLWVHGAGDVDEAAEHVMAASRVPPSVRSASARLLAESEFGIDRCALRYAELFDHLDPTIRSGYDAHLYHRVARFLSPPIAASRIVRLWAANRMRPLVAAKRLPS
ncbi:MAG: glycosyltransferase family 4 protein [Gemmatimonadaceae bacterium]